MQTTPYPSQNPPPGLASLPLARPKLWREGVLSFLNPVDIVRLAGVCRHYRYPHISLVQRLIDCFGLQIE